MRRSPPVASCSRRRWLGSARAAAPSRRKSGVAGDASAVDEWRGRFPVFEQPKGGLGTRMAAAFDAGVAVVVGSDIPKLDVDYVETALRALAGADLVLGPTEDGGYCLIAMNELHPELFVNIPWGTEAVLAATLRAAGSLSVRTLDVLWDVDEAADWERWRSMRPTGQGPAR